MANKYCLFLAWNSISNALDSHVGSLVKFDTKFNPNLNKLFLSFSYKLKSKITRLFTKNKIFERLIISKIDITYIKSIHKSLLIVRKLRRENRLKNTQYRFVRVVIFFQKWIFFEYEILKLYQHLGCLRSTIYLWTILKL